MRRKEGGSKEGMTEGAKNDEIWNPRALHLHPRGSRQERRLKAIMQIYDEPWEKTAAEVARHK